MDISCLRSFQYWQAVCSPSHVLRKNWASVPCHLGWINVCAVFTKAGVICAVLTGSLAVVPAPVRGNSVLQAPCWPWREPCWPSRAWTAWGHWHISPMKYGGIHTVLMTVTKQGKGNLSCIPLPPPRIWVIINLQSFVQKNKPKSSHCLPKHVFMSTTSPKRPFYCEQMWSPSVTASVWRAFVLMGTSWHWGTYLTNLVAKLSKEVAQCCHIPLVFTPECLMLCINSLVGVFNSLPWCSHTWSLNCLHVGS